jgi:hypothetical protein
MESAHVAIVNFLNVLSSCHPPPARGHEDGDPNAGGDPSSDAGEDEDHVDLGQGADRHGGELRVRRFVRAYGSL